MSRKPKLAPRNPLVAPSMFRKAGAHGKPHKAQRRADKNDLNRRVAQLDRAPGFYPVGSEFESQYADHENPHDWRCDAASHSFEFSVPQ